MLYSDSRDHVKGLIATLFSIGNLSGFFFLYSIDIHFLQQRIPFYFLFVELFIPCGLTYWHISQHLKDSKQCIMKYFLRCCCLLVVALLLRERRLPNWLYGPQLVRFRRGYTLLLYICQVCSSLFAVIVRYPDNGASAPKIRTRSRAWAWPSERLRSTVSRLTTVHVSWLETSHTKFPEMSALPAALFFEIVCATWKWRKDK